MHKRVTGTRSSTRCARRYRAIPRRLYTRRVIANDSYNSHQYSCGRPGLLQRARTGLRIKSGLKPTLARPEDGSDQAGRPRQSGGSCYRPKTHKKQTQLGSKAHQIASKPHQNRSPADETQKETPPNQTSEDLYRDRPFNTRFRRRPFSDKHTPGKNPGAQIYTL